MHGEGAVLVTETTPPYACYKQQMASQGMTQLLQRRHWGGAITIAFPSNTGSVLLSGTRVDEAGAVVACEAEGRFIQAPDALRQSRPVVVGRHAGRDMPKASLSTGEGVPGIDLIPS